MFLLRNVQLHNKAQKFAVQEVKTLLESNDGKLTFDAFKVNFSKKKQKLC
jgi:hypothetical protein